MRRMWVRLASAVSVVVVATALGALAAVPAGADVDR